MDFYRFFPEKYRLATRGLTPYQDGCYRRLIDEYMRTRRPLPDNEAALADICRISIEQWTSNACSMLVAFFRQKNGMLFHDYCDQELDFQDGKRKFHSERAKKAGLERWKKNNNLDATSIPQAMLQHARVESRESIEGSKEEPSKRDFDKKPKKPKSEFRLPEWIDADAWAAFEQHRKRKSPMTDRARELIVLELEKLRAAGQSPKAVLEQSIMRGWQGVFPLKQDGANGAKGSGKPNYSETLMGAYEIAVNEGRSKGGTDEIY